MSASSKYLIDVFLTAFFAILCGILHASFSIFIGHYLTISIRYGPNSTLFSAKPITSKSNVDLINCIIKQLTIGSCIFLFNFIMVRLFKGKINISNLLYKI